MKVTVYITLDQFSDSMIFCMASIRSQIEFSVRTPKGHDTGICLCTKAMWLSERAFKQVSKLDFALKVD